MSGGRPSVHVERALFVVLIIAGAIGSAVWDVHGVASAIAAGKLASAGRDARPVRRAAGPSVAAASAVPVSSVLARLAP